MRRIGPTCPTRGCTVQFRLDKSVPVFFDHIPKADPVVMLLQ